MSLENLNVAELSVQNLQTIEGGLADPPKYGYWGYSWSGTENELVYAGEAVWNLGVSLVNGAAWIGNQLP
jgi:hypothetical protein